jgi:hypothetical protein
MSKFRGIDGDESARMLFEKADAALSAPLKLTEYTLNWWTDPGNKPVNCATLHEVVFIMLVSLTDTTR